MIKVGSAPAQGPAMVARITALFPCSCIQLRAEAEVFPNFSLLVVWLSMIALCHSHYFLNRKELEL